MTLDDFRALETAEGGSMAAQMDFVGRLISDQNPRLRRGADMTGPIITFCEGQIPDEAERTRSLFFPDQDVVHPLSTSVAAKSIRSTVKQVLEGHPFLELNVPDTANYFHLYEVQVLSDLGKHSAGDVIPVVINKHIVPVTLTQKMLDDTSYILIRIAFSY